MRPVIGRSDPPCSVTDGGPLASVVVQKLDNQDVACYRLDRPRISADMVSTAAAREDPASGAWEVTIALSTEGKASYERLVNEIGTQREVALVLDGEVVALLATLDPEMEIVVTGFDEPIARRLAERLHR